MEGVPQLSDIPAPPTVSLLGNLLLLPAPVPGEPVLPGPDVGAGAGAQPWPLLLSCLQPLRDRYY